MKSLLFLIAAIAIVLTGASNAAGKNPKIEVQRIGAMVLAIDAALKAPAKKESLETIVSYGTDSRHYVMIRGWLAELLKGTESQLDAVRDPKLKAKHQEKATFLKKAIRRIDLE